MKKYVLVFGLLIIGLSFTACTKDSEDFSEIETSSEIEKVEIANEKSERAA